jgi:hypothetical protein
MRFGMIYDKVCRRTKRDTWQSWGKHALQISQKVSFNLENSLRLLQQEPYKMKKLQNSPKNKNMGPYKTWRKHDPVPSRHHWTNSIFGHLLRASGSKPLVEKKMCDTIVEWMKGLPSQGRIRSPYNQEQLEQGGCRRHQSLMSHRTRWETPRGRYDEHSSKFFSVWN